MTRTSVATDGFPTDGLLGANWAYLRDTAFQPNPPRVSSGVVIASSTVPTSYQVCRWGGAGTFTDDQYAKATIGGLSFFNSQFQCGVVVRASADLNTAADFYAFFLWSDSAGPNYTTKLVKMVNGTETVLDSASRPWTNGDTIELEAVTNGSQVELYCYRNGTLISGLDPFIDTGADRLLTGKPGLQTCGDGSSLIATLDDWEGGNLVSAATSYTLTGPSSGTVGTASSNFTVTPNGALSADTIVTPSDGGDGGTFTPTSVTFASGTSAPQTFTYTPASAGVKTISTTNNGGLTDPASVSFTASAASSFQAAWARNSTITLKGAV